MSRLPRDLSGAQLVVALERSGYVVTRQSGSHVRLTTEQRGEHHVSVPLHSALRVGTAGAILSDVAAHLGLSRDALIDRLFG